MTSFPSTAMSATDLPKRFGWVGLGAMGFPMANQLTKKLDASCELFIYDLDSAVLQNFIEVSARSGGPSVTIVASPREVAELSVSMAKNQAYATTLA